MTSKELPLFQYGKRKVAAAECSNYHPIRLLSHTMKIFERILDNGIREIVKPLTVNQAGFVKNCGTSDAIQAARLLMENHREKHRPLYIAFLELEKAFDRDTPTRLVCSTTALSARRTHALGSSSTTIRKVTFEVCAGAGAGVSKPLRVSVGVLSPLLFVLIIDIVTRDIQIPAPYTLLYAGDVFLASNSKNDLEQL